jgi:hypothetical protein
MPSVRERLVNAPKLWFDLQAQELVDLPRDSKIGARLACSGEIPPTICSAIGLVRLVESAPGSFGSRGELCSQHGMFAYFVILWAYI